MSANEGEPQPLIDDELGGVREECQEGEKDTEYHDRLRVNLSTLDEGHPHDAAGVNRKVHKVTHKPSFLSRPPRSGCLGVLDRLRLAFNVIIPYGGLLSSSFNLASATLGAGIISTPSAFNLSGVVMSTIYLVLVTLGTIYSMNLIAKVIVKTGVRTFAQAARQILGPGADHILATLLIILCFGGSVAYIIATSTLLTPILSTDSAPAYLKTKSGNRLITSLFWLCFMVPLVIPKKVNSLRYISTFAIFFVMYFVVCIVIHSTQNGLKDSTIRKEMVMVRTGNTALEGLGVFMFALLCQINGFEIFLEMRVRTVFNFTLYTTIATVLCSTLYFLAGFFGYADFGERVKDSVLKLYDPISEPYILVGYIGIIIKICVAFALHMIPFRDAIYHFLKWEADSVPYWQHSLVMLIPSTLALLGGLFIPYVNTVFGLLGSFCGGIIGMIMPALFYMYAGNFSLKETGILNYVSTYLLLLGGVCAVVFGTVTTIYSTVMSSFA